MISTPAAQAMPEGRSMPADGGLRSVSRPLWMPHCRASERASLVGSREDDRGQWTAVAGRDNPMTPSSARRPTAPDPPSAAHPWARTSDWRSLPSPPSTSSSPSRTATPGVRANPRRGDRRSAATRVRGRNVLRRKRSCSTPRLSDRKRRSTRKTSTRMPPNGRIRCGIKQNCRGPPTLWATASAASDPVPTYCDAWLASLGLGRAHSGLPPSRCDE